MIGISIANSLGLNRVSAGINPDAAAFIAAAGITGTTQVDAVNALVNGLQADGLWSKMKAVYPFVTDNRNLLSYTEAFNNGVYSVTGSGITANTTNAPNGTLTADTIKEDATTGQHRIFQFFNATAGTAYTASIFCKAGVGNRNITVLFGCGFGADNRVTFNVNNGTIVASSSATGTITDVGNGWYRCTVSATASASVSSCLQYQLRDGTTEIYAGDNTSSLIIWGAQVEQSATPSAYQPILTTQQAYIASQFKYNLKDPRDLDAAFRLVFNGGWTHSSTGATPNGTNGYADTKLNDNTVLNLNDVHSSVYSRTNVDGAFCDLGVSGTVNSGVNTFIRLTNKTYFRLHEEDVNTVTTNDSRGFFLGWRNSSTIKNIAVNGTKTAFTSAVGGKSNGNIYLGALYNIPTVSATSFSPRQLAFSSIGDGLTDTDATNLYNSVQTYQTSLSRQV